MKKKFIVVKSTAKETEVGQFITKLMNETIQETEFGTKKSKQTLYVKGTVQFKEGDEVEVNLNRYDIVEHVSTFPDKETGEMITRTLKWLHLKAA